MNNSNRRIKGLGEVSIRVRDLDAMHKFYEEVIGLEVLPTGGCARRDESLGLKVDATVHEWFFVFVRCTSPTQKGSAEVCLLRCKCGRGECWHVLKERLDKFCLSCRHTCDMTSPPQSLSLPLPAKQKEAAIPK